MRVFLLLFIVMPILEMWLLIKVGGAIGALPTILLVLATAMIGLAMLKQQGLATLFQARQRLDHGELPAEQIVTGFILAISGALLLTPGFVTDAIGFAGLIPALRDSVIRKFAERLIVVSGQGASHRAGNGSPLKDNQTIEGEFWRDKDQ